MRILLITTGLRMGGAEQQVAALAREFLARGHGVALISLTPDCEVPMPDAVERLMLDLHKNPLSMVQALRAARTCSTPTCLRVSCRGSPDYRRWYARRTAFPRADGCACGSIG